MYKTGGFPTIASKDILETIPMRVLSVGDSRLEKGDYELIRSRGHLLSHIVAAVACALARGTGLTDILPIGGTVAVSGNLHSGNTTGAATGGTRRILIERLRNTGDLSQSETDNAAKTHEMTVFHRCQNKRADHKSLPLKTQGRSRLTRQLVSYEGCVCQALI